MKRVCIILLGLSLLFAGCGQKEGEDATKLPEMTTAGANNPSAGPEATDREKNTATPKPTENNEQNLEIVYSKALTYINTKNGGVYETHRYDYNDKNLVIQRTVFNHTGAFKSRQKYAYDAKGNMTERIILDEKFKPTGAKYLYTYSAEGKEVKQETYDKTAKLSSTLNYVYNDGGQLTKVVETRTGKDPYDRNRYTYDNKGSLIKEETYSSLSSRAPLVTEYTCDESGRVLIRRTLGDGDATGLNNTSTRYEYTYNADGSYKVVSTSEGKKEKVLVTTVCDAQGFPLSEVSSTYTTTFSDVK